MLFRSGQMEGSQPGWVDVESGERPEAASYWDGRAVEKGGGLFKAIELCY